MKRPSKYTPPTMSTMSYPWGSFGPGGYTETDQYKGIRETGEDTRMQVLQDLGVSLPDRISQSQEWRDMYMKHAGDPAARKTQEQFQRRGMTGTHMATALADLWNKVGREAFLQSEGLRQGEERLKLARLQGLTGMLEGLYGLGFKSGNQALNKFALDSSNAYKAWAGNQAAQQAYKNAWLTGITGIAGAAPSFMFGPGGTTGLLNLFKGATGGSGTTQSTKIE